MAPSAEPVLRCVDLECGYPGHRVLAGVNLEVHPGEIVALLGPNGSGKSTLLKTICQTLRPVAGQVEVAGCALKGLSVREVARKVAYVPQEETPAFDFSSLQVVLMGRFGHSTGLFETKEDYRVAHEAMAQSDCEAFADRHVSELSGGERQRVLIARALAQQAPLLLLDEPTSHLDIGHQLDTGELLRSLARNGLGILVAVHDLNWAATFANRSVLLSGGAIAHEGPTDEVLSSVDLQKAFGVGFELVRGSAGSAHLFPSRRQ